MTPGRVGYVSAQSDAVEAFVHDGWDWTAAKRIPRSARAPAFGAFDRR